MRFTTNSVELREEAYLYTATQSAYLPLDAQAKLKAAMAQSSSPDQICETAEALYAHYDLLDNTGREVMARLFAYAGRSGWSSFDVDGRCNLIVGVVQRDLGEVSALPFPAAGEEPAPQKHRRENEADWRDGIVATLDQAQREKWERTKALRATSENGGAETPVGRVQTDDESKMKINGLVTMALVANGNNQPFSESFTLADNSVVTLDGTTTIQMGVAVGQHVSAAHARSRELRDQIFATDATIETVQAIDVTTGWPG